MKCLLHKYSLLALLTLALPVALAGCSKSADSDMTSATTPPADTNAAMTNMTMPATNDMSTNAPAPMMDTNAPATNMMAAPTNAPATTNM